MYAVRPRFGIRPYRPTLARMVVVLLLEPDATLIEPTFHDTTKKERRPGGSPLGPVTSQDREAQPGQAKP